MWILSLIHFDCYCRKKLTTQDFKKQHLPSYLTGIESVNRLKKDSSDSIICFSFFFFLHFFHHLYSQTVSHPHHYPPIRQVRDELEGRANNLDSPLSAPFRSAPPSRQLLGPSVKFTPLLISMLMPKSKREAAQSDACWGF